jgi:hypothetical protein
MVFEVSPDPEAAEAARGAFDAATCLTTGEKPPTWPPLDAATPATK